MKPRADPMLGNVLRRLRTSRRLTLAAVAARVGCAQSLISQVEKGARALHPWLAEALDQMYGTGGAVVGLTAETPSQETAHDVLLIQVPWKGHPMPASRRALLAALSVGALGAVPGLSAWAEDIRADEQALAELARGLADVRASGRILPPAALLDTLTGQAAVIDLLRRKAPAQLRRDYAMLQTRCAESLSWMAEEAGDFTAALYWTDRVQAWAQLAAWPAMWSYGNVRRSMIAITAGYDGQAAVDYAALVWRSRAELPDRLRGFAAYQAARGFALTGDADASRYAIDEALDLFTRNHDDSDPTKRVGQHSVPTADLMVMYQATCDAYAGGSDHAIRELAPRLESIAKGSTRSHAIQSSIVALGLVNAGEPGPACNLILSTLDTAVESATAHGEIRRLVPTLLTRWPARDDVQEIAHRLTVTA